MNNNNTVIQPTEFKPTRGEEPAKRSLTRLRNGLLIGAFGLGVVVLLFLLLSRSVYVETFPADAQVDVVSGFTLPFTDRYLMLQGNYDVEIQAEGYRSLAETINVDDTPSQTFTFTLDKLPGHLEITVAGEVAAELLLDGDVVLAQPVPDGFSWPFTLREVEPGAHKLEVRAPGFVTHVEGINVEGLDKIQQVAVELTPNSALLGIASKPPGATLEVNGKALGVTPFEGRIDPGQAELSLTLAGYKVWRRQVTSAAGDELRMETVELIPADGQVLVRSEPSGAALTVDGSYRGVTPIQVELSPEQEHTLTLFKEGYQPLEHRMRAEQSSETEITLKLAINLVEVTFRATPADARLSIDGRDRGSANQSLKLSTGKHRIVISKPGYVDFVTEIKPSKGVQQLVEANLVTAEEAKWAGLPDANQTSAGQALKLFRPEQAFLMGAPRRERGRQANEVQRKVLLGRSFYMSLREVTNSEYRKFAAQHSSGRVGKVSLDKSDHPVVNVSWEDAARYCNWLSSRESLSLVYTEENSRITGMNVEATGYRLPTEAEWAWVARVDQANPSAPAKRYPWGTSLPPPPGAGNFADESAVRFIAKILKDYTDGYATTAPVGKFTPNHNGMYDIVGNVAEWVHDYYEVKVTTTSRTETDPTGPGKGRYHVVRGSGWKHSSLTELRLSFRDYSDVPRNDVGFRLARWVE